MAQRIAITPEELRQVGGEFVSSASQIGDIMAKMEAQMNSLESSWEGAAQLSFYDQYAQKKQTIQQFQEMVNAFGEQLKSVARELEGTDEALANALK